MKHRPQLRMLTPRSYSGIQALAVAIPEPDPGRRGRNSSGAKVKIQSGYGKSP